MRRALTIFGLCCAGLLIQPMAVAIAGNTCPPGQAMECPPPPKTRPPHGDNCHCVKAGGIPGGGGPHAEIKKKNVPKVKPNNAPGRNN